MFELYDAHACHYYLLINYLSIAVATVHMLGTVPRSVC